MGAPWLNLGEILRVNARKFPDKVAFKEKSRQFTFAETNQRVNQLAHGLLSLGLNKGDKVTVLLENCVEIIEVYIACAKTGLVINPINFRLSESDIAYIADNADAKVFIVDSEFVPVVDGIRNQLPKVNHYLVVTPLLTPPARGGELRGRKDYINYDEFVKKFPTDEPKCQISSEDTWVLLYTSGTTGRPKGVVRSHESYVAFYFINAVDFGFTPDDICLNIMPLCHINSTFYSFNFTYIGGTVYIHPARHFEPAEILQIIERERITFISLIPTHYSLILDAPEADRQKYDVSSIRKLLCSSAPARGEIKNRIMDFFKGVELYEAYGSTEAGIVTILRPHEQMSKLGSIGRESSGTDEVKLLDENGQSVKVGEVGELYARSPMLFDEYYKLPEKTKQSFRGGWFSAGDLARQDEDGYYYIVDRKDNMIITGGEHVYPSEVEEVISRHPKVFDVAVIGVPDDKWGEAVKAVVILKEGAQVKPEEIIDLCRGQMAGYKKPKSVDFIKSEEMPRTGSGKVLHRELRRRYSG